MPELPEVEQFRQLLLPLVSASGSSPSPPSPPSSTASSPDAQQQQQQQQQKQRRSLPLTITAVKDSPPKNWLSTEQIAVLSSGNYVVSDVVRKGKLLCLVLDADAADTATTTATTTATQDDNKTKKKQQRNTATTKSQKIKTYYLFLHMGMTGRISTPDHICALETLKGGGDYPPPYTYLTFQAGTYEVAFSDPRKFGSCELRDDMTPFDRLAPDGLLDLLIDSDDHSKIPTTILARLSNQKIGIKALLLDQKRVVSGVGNWVADEVLCTVGMHPDQSNLTVDEATTVLQALHQIFVTAVDCSNRNEPYPAHWLFHYRWTKKSRGSKDGQGRLITFITSGGRTSAVVASIQKLYKRKKPVAVVNDGGERASRSTAPVVDTAAPSTKQRSPSTSSSNRSMKKRSCRKEVTPVTVSAKRQRRQRRTV